MENLNYPQMLKVHKFIFSAAKEMDRVLDESIDVGFSQCMILMFVEKNPRISQIHICRERDITPAAVSRHVDVLVKKGYLTQKNNIDNKREHILELSAKGRDMLRDASGIVNRELDRFFQDISHDEIETIDRVFTKLLSVFDLKNDW